MLDELSLARLHAIEEHNTEVVAGCDPLKLHDQRGYLPAFLTEAVITASEVFTQSVHDDKLEVGKSLDNLLEFLLE